MAKQWQDILKAAMIGDVGDNPIYQKSLAMYKNMILMTEIPSTEYKRAEFVGSELFDFGRDVALLLKTDQGNVPILLSRHEAQKLFDEMWWAYYFRPTENP